MKEIEIYQVIETLKEKIVNIQFQKQDGSTRKMRATLSSEYLPIFEGNPSRAKSDQKCSVWDVDLGSWRGFSWDKLQVFDGEDVVVIH